MSNKLLVIGLDGASFNVLDPLIEKAYLPNIARLIEEGSRADLETTLPPITAVAWSSFMTGKNPGKHGIFEFEYKAKAGRVPDDPIRQSDKSQSTERENSRADWNSREKRTLK